MLDWSALHELARERDGVFRLRHAGRLGLTAGGPSRYASGHGCARPYPGVLIVPGTAGGFRRATMVAVEALGGERLLVARRAAAYLWAMTTSTPDVLELLVPWSRTGLKVGEWDSTTRSKARIPRSCRS